MQKGCKSKKSMPNVRYWMKSEKKGSEKGPKKGYCERSGFQLPFSSLFRSLFASLSRLHAVWVLLLFLKGHIAPQMLKKDWGEFFWIL
jgi:hypothetical protein